VFSADENDLVTLFSDIASKEEGLSYLELRLSEMK